MIWILIKYYIRTGLFLKFHLVLVPIIVNIFWGERIIFESIGLILFSDEYCNIKEKAIQRFPILPFNGHSLSTFIKNLNVIQLISISAWLSLGLIWTGFKSYYDNNYIVFYELTLFSAILSVIGNLISLFIPVSTFWKYLIFCFLFFNLLFLESHRLLLLVFLLLLLIFQELIFLKYDSCK